MAPTLTVQDTTGAYADPGNLGGYGTPNPDPSNLIQVRWKLWESCTWLLVSGSYDSAAVQAGLAITTINLSLSTNLNLLPDGVEEVQLLEGYPMDTGKSLNVTTGANTAILNGFVPSDFTSIKYISFISIPDEIFQILSIVGNTMTLDRIYDGVLTSENLNQWYDVELPVLVQTMGNNNINQQLTRVTADSLVGDKLLELAQQTMNGFAASARFDAGDNLGANTLALSVANHQYYRRYHQ